MSISQKWVEVNIHVGDWARGDTILFTFVKDYVRKVKERVREKERDVSWHFLREPCPVLPDVPEIRLRFFGDAKDIVETETELRTELVGISTPPPHFGAHGRPGIVYDGEVGGEGAYDGFGREGWQVFIKFLQNSSETALEFLEKESHHSSEKAWDHYIERFVHLSMNQIGVQTYLAEKDGSGNIPLRSYPCNRWLLVPLEENES